MSLEQEFEQATLNVKKLKKKPSNETLLKLYSLYKQATAGDIEGERPAGFDFKAIAKYDAWKELKGMDNQEARKEYIQLVNSLLLA